MDLIDLEDETIDAEVMDSLAVTMDDFRVSPSSLISYTSWISVVERVPSMAYIAQS